MALYGDLRALHTIIAALWVGSATFLTLFVEPALRGLNARAAVMRGMKQRHFDVFFMLVGMITVLSGIWLYWLFTDGFKLARIDSAQGIVFGLGDLAGIAAAVIGGAVISRAAARSMALNTQLAQMPAGTERSATERTLAMLERRVATASRMDMLLLLSALVLMSIGHLV